MSSPTPDDEVYSVWVIRADMIRAVRELLTKKLIRIDEVTMKQTSSPSGRHIVTQCFQPGGRNILAGGVSHRSHGRISQSPAGDTSVNQLFSPEGEISLPVA